MFFSYSCPFLLPVRDPKLQINQSGDRMASSAYVVLGAPRAKNGRDFLVGTTNPKCVNPEWVRVVVSVVSIWGSFGRFLRVKVMKKQ